MAYKLRECIQAHDQDVKSLCSLDNGYGFISGSRDLTVRLWKEEFNSFKEEKKYLFHKCYISAVIYMNPSILFPDGIILSSGYDKIIYAYSPLNGERKLTLTGHTDSITSLSVSGMDLVSGSMDKTAIVWNLNSNSISGTLKGVFKGHSHGIWAVVLLQSIEHGLLTASADKEIFLWDTKSKTKMRQFSGHTDCVRNVIEIAEQKQFLSCSNDTTIRLWSLNNSACIKEFYGHNAYIYSMCTLPDGDSFVSCGEDGMVCVWDLKEGSKPLQTIVHYAQSVWCVSTLNNGDIVTGASDGRIRLFSMHNDLQNGIELAPIKSNDLINDQVVAELPSVGIEVLSLPGEYDGQLIKVSDDGIEVLYGWSVIKDTWVKQKVVDNNNKSSEKKTHDYMFSIDIKDGEPALKLGYNKGEDPWTVAHKFLEDNDLSSMFLDQVANFIISNTTPSSGPVLQNTTYSDPFTGANRYVPDMSQQTIAQAKMFPHKVYVRFDQINATGLAKKIVEILGSNGVPSDVIALIEGLNNLQKDDCYSLYEWVLKKLPEWDNEMLFPLMDVLRMLVRDPLCNSSCFTDHKLLTELVPRTLGLMSKCSKANMLTIVKLMVNGFCHVDGAATMLRKLPEFSDQLRHSLAASTNYDKPVMNAVSSWFLNASVLVNGRPDDNIWRIDLLECCFLVLEQVAAQATQEAVHRMLVTIGSLVCNTDSFTFRENLTVGIFDRISQIAKQYQDKEVWGPDAAQCAKQLAELVASLELFNF